jgi:hypothetical protein
MALLPDSEAERLRRALRDAAGRTDPEVLARWLRLLLDDRQERLAIAQRLSRRAHYVRQRFSQAARYLDGLLDELERISREPWPGKLPCPHCGAPSDQVRAEYRPDDPRRHVLVHGHPDGTDCEPSAEPADVRRAAR